MNNENILKNKILLVITNRYPPKNGGVEGIFVKNQVDALKNYFDKIFVVAFPPYIPKILTPLLSNRRREEATTENYNYDNIHVKYIKEIFIPCDNIRAHFKDRLYKKVECLMKKENIHPDLIHAHFTWPAGYVAVNIGKKYKVPVVITAHGYDIYDLPFRNNFYNTLITNTLNAANHIITVSKKNVEYIKKLNIDTPVSVIPNGFDNHLFYPMDKEKCRNNLNLPINKKIILSVGNLTPIKGHKYLIYAAKKVSEKRKDVLFIIVGTGPLKKDLQNKIKNLNLENYVWLVGGKPHEEIPWWMNAADLFVLPSLNEGNPTVMFEALGVGLPFVGTTVGGVPEIITSEDYGFLCPPKDSVCLSEKILTALDKTWNREKIRAFALQFSWDKSISKIIKIYDIPFQNI